MFLKKKDYVYEVMTTLVLKKRETPPKDYIAGRLIFSQLAEQDFARLHSLHLFIQRGRVRVKEQLEGFTELNVHRESPADAL